MYVSKRHINNRLATEEFKDVRKEDFLAKYTSLVQRLSLLLLQVRAVWQGCRTVCLRFDHLSVVRTEYATVPFLSPATIANHRHHSTPAVLDLHLLF